MERIMMMVVALFVIATMNLMAEDAEAPESKDPKELQDARVEYRNQIKAITDPVTKKYVGKLENMKKRLGAKGDVEGAVAIENEIKNLTEKPEDVNNDADISEPVGKKFKIIKIEDIKDKSANAVLYGGKPDLLWANGEEAYYSFSTTFKPGKCYVYALYASGEVRPCKVSVNGGEGRKAFEKMSGGFDSSTLISDSAGPFNVTGNKITVKIQAVGCSPHFYGFAVSSTMIKDLKKEDFKK